MIRGFVAGLFWGCIVAALGLGALSLGTPLVPALPPAPAEVTLVEPPRIEPAAAPPTAEPPAAEVAAPAEPAELPAAPEVFTAEPPASPPLEVIGAVEMSPAATVQSVPDLPVPGEGVLQSPARPAAETAPSATDHAAAPAAALPEVLPAGPVVLPVVPPALLPEPVPDVPDDPIPPAPAAEPAPPAPAATPDGGRIARLPRIGDAPAVITATAEPVPASESALLRNARPFDNPAGKPTFAVLLLDSLDSTTDLAALAAADLPITLLIDPMTDGAAERAALWHAGGQEVALLTSGLPRKGAAADFEVALEVLASQFPQALALVDTAANGLQGDRMTAAALVPALRARGYGLVTWERGLNAADQVARREGLAAATVFRDLDGGDEAAPVIRRYLDRAAFKAQQDGRVVVFGRLRPDTVAALLEWGLDGRAATLALAPLSALLTAN